MTSRPNNCPCLGPNRLRQTRKELAADSVYQKTVMAEKVTKQEQDVSRRTCTTASRIGALRTRAHSSGTQRECTFRGDTAAVHKRDPVSRAQCAEQL
ncbi:hypothetical protein H6P81_006440 [Aristolochia fimbriata]|uniref:Uncharacterized protein n=1 Tax=Aristolochia fimbriata TaxID=158543 RepID=A0AAV7F040_ARIFI|nr:hypothetical protein H6P81_006440 [Aristolochia fimbriata]